MSLNEQDIVVKLQGYTFEGIIVAKFETTKQKVRFVVEHAETGMLHIFNGKQLSKVNERRESEIRWKISNRETLQDLTTNMIQKELKNV
jgi:hypothetical protein